MWSVRALRHASRSLADGFPSWLRLDRDCKAIVPIDIEALRQLAYHRPDDREVDIAEFQFRAGLEILVTYVAASGHGNGVIADEELVVHPIVEPAGLEQVLDSAQEGEILPCDLRIEDANFDVRVCNERPYLGVAVDSELVIEQEPHAYAAVCGRQQRREQKLACGVLLQHEILDIERPFRLLRDPQSHGEAVGPIHQQIEAGLPGVFAGERVKTPAKRRRLRLRQCRRRGLRRVEAGRQRCAPGHQHRRGKNDDVQRTRPGSGHLSRP